MTAVQFLGFQPTYSVNSLLGKKTTKAPSSFSTLITRVESGFIDASSITEILHNKVLIAAIASSAIGQLLKPCTSAIFYGKKFDLKDAIQAGGFPSTHSSAVVATATSIGLERGFSDSIFGLVVVYAGLTMYDAQGVRREVGTHAKVLNTSFLSNTSHRSNLITSNKGGDSLFDSDGKNGYEILLLESDREIREKNQMMIPPSNSVSSPLKESISSPLKESIGHTEIEVIAGALLGLCVSLAICNSIV